MGKEGCFRNYKQFPLSSIKFHVFSKVCYTEMSPCGNIEKNQEQEQ